MIEAADLLSDDYFQPTLFKVLDNRFRYTGVRYNVLYLFQFAYLADATLSEFRAVGQYHHDLGRIDHLLVDVGFGEVANGKPEIEVDSIHTDEQHPAGNPVKHIFGVRTCYGR